MHYHYDSCGVLMSSKNHTAALFIHADVDFPFLLHSITLIIDFGISKKESGGRVEQLAFKKKVKKIASYFYFNTLN